MIEIDVCIPIIAAVLGIGYPILLQIVINLEDKYNSSLIVEIFKSEPKNLFLNVSLILALLSALLVLLNRPPWFDFGFLNILVDNSAVSLLILFTIILVIAFFLFLSKVLIYKSKKEFIIYLIKKYSKSNQRINIFRAISELLYNSIRTQDKESAETISRFVYDAFLKYRQLSIDCPVVYPSEYYELAYKTTEELTLLSDNRLSFLESRSVGAIWLLGEHKDFEISETTYRWLWRNLTLPVNYNKDNMIMSFWETANQYYTYNLQRIDEEYSENGQVKNNDRITERTEARKRFLEFTNVLGALLLYKRRYGCLARMFRYTTSIPPTHELLPASMDEIINLYIKYRDPYDDNYPWISSKYYFPEIEGLKGDYIIKNWICTYIAVLLIRQYSIMPYLITMAPLEFPNLPATQWERKVWLDNLDHLRRLVEDVLQDSELLEILNYKFLTREWCTKNEKIYPPEFVKQLKTIVDNEYNKHEIVQDLSQEKVENFCSTTKRVITETLKSYECINNPTRITEQYNQLFIVGERAIIDKSSFAVDQASENMNYDSFLAEATSKKIQRGMSEILFSMKSKTYLYKKEDIFPAIDRLNVNTNDFIIIGFEYHMEYYLKELKVPGLSSNKYNNLDFVNFPQFNFNLLGESFFVLKKSDLPNIDHLAIEKNEIEKYSLNLLDKEFNLYASVIDFFKQTDLQKEYIDSANDRDINKSVLVSIILSTRIRWSKNVRVIHIKSFTKYMEKGLPNELKDIIPIG